MSRSVITTRRALFGGAIGIGALAVLPAKGSPNISQSDFIKSISFIHSHGRQAALQALAGGMKPEWLYTVMLIGDGHRWPALLFKTDTGEHVTFRPTGRD